jgi:hypothetical protein
MVGLTSHVWPRIVFINEPVPNRAAYFVTPSVLHSMQLLKDFLIDLGYSK